MLLGPFFSVAQNLFWMTIYGRCNPEFILDDYRAKRR